MTPFLNCNIWSVPIMGHTEDGFYFVNSVYHHDSLNQNYNPDIEPGLIQVPEFLIENLELLRTINFSMLNDHRIPILKGDGDKWKIDLTHYDKYTKL